MADYLGATARQATAEDLRSGCTAEGKVWEAQQDADDPDGPPWCELVSVSELTKAEPRPVNLEEENEG